MAISRAYEYLLNICKFVVDDAPRPDLMRPEDNRAIPVHVDSVDWVGASRAGGYLICPFRVGKQRCSLLSEEAICTRLNSSLITGLQSTRKFG